jgi:Zn-dependent protease with chaperone function
MPDVVLLIAILVLVALAVRSMLAAVAEVRWNWVQRSMPGETLEIPDDPPEGVEADLFGWIHQRLVDAYAAEQAPWALEQVRRVDARLQADVPRAERLETLVLWIPEKTAFTFPGRHLYLSRALLERAHSDDAVAFIVAHELAHHRLGHLATSLLLERLPGPLQAAATGVIATRWFALSAGREADADVHALNLCLAAGYDAHRCLAAFDLLEAAALDEGDIEGVFGADAAIAAALEDRPEWLVHLHEWLYERRRGYPALRERKARLLAAYDQAVAAAAAGD